MRPRPCPLTTRNTQHKTQNAQCTVWSCLYALSSLCCSTEEMCSAASQATRPLMRQLTALQVRALRVHLCLQMPVCVCALCVCTVCVSLHERIRGYTFMLCRCTGCWLRFAALQEAHSSRLAAADAAESALSQRCTSKPQMERCCLLLPRAAAQRPSLSTAFVAAPCLICAANSASPPVPIQSLDCGVRGVSSAATSEGVSGSARCDPAVAGRCTGGFMVHTP